METPKTEERMLDNEPEHQSADQDFDGGVIGKTVSEDPLLKFLAGEWRSLVGCIAVAILGYFGYSSYIGVVTGNQREAADQLAGVRADYDSIVLLGEQFRTEKDESAKAEKKKKFDEAKVRLDERIKGLSETVSPYKETAPIYSALVSVEAGNIPTITAAGESGWEQAKADSSTRFVGEIQALLNARILVDNAERRAEGVSALEKLASSADSVAVPSVVTLATIANSPAEKEKVKKLIDNLVQREAYYGTVLKEARARLD